MSINRRELVCSLAAGSLLPAALSAQPTQAPGGAALLDAYVRLSGSHDDRLVIWWMDGIRYGVVAAETQALFGMKVGMFHRFFRQTDGSFKIAFFELTYYTDLQTGKLLTTFDNPYTGETNKVRHVRLGPEVRRLTADGLSPPEGPGLSDLVKRYYSSLGPAVTRGGDIWIPTSVEALIRFPKPNAPDILLNLYTTVHGSIDAALDTLTASANCDLAFSNVLKWEPWMAMGDHAGHMMSKAEGRKLESVDALPDDYLACARAVHPRYIDDPPAALQRQVEKIKKPA